MSRRRVASEGSALVELTWLGILLLVPMLWIVLSVFEVQRGAFAVSGAARAAGRAYALAPTDAEGRPRAEAAARQALADQGVDGAPLDVTDHLHAVPRTTATAARSVITVVIASAGRPAAAARASSAATRRASRSTPPTPCRSASSRRSSA